MVMGSKFTHVIDMDKDHFNVQVRYTPVWLLVSLMPMFGVHALRVDRSLRALGLNRLHTHTIVSRSKTCAKLVRNRLHIYHCAGLQDTHRNILGYRKRKCNICDSSKGEQGEEV
jgi:hypothetical protein